MQFMPLANLVLYVMCVLKGSDAENRYGKAAAQHNKESNN